MRTPTVNGVKKEKLEVRSILNSKFSRKTAILESVLLLQSRCEEDVEMLKHLIRISEIGKALG